MVVRATAMVAARGTDNNQPKGAAEEMMAVGTVMVVEPKSCDGDSGNNYADADADDSALTAATRMTLLGCALWIETTRSPWPSMAVAVMVRTKIGLK
jgi:hypothetical protein